MKHIKVVIPPCVTSRNSFNFGQAINFIYADVIARYHKLCGDCVEFTPYSWNNHARRTEELIPHLRDYNDLLFSSEELVVSMEQSLQMIGVISSDGRYIDSDVEQQKIVKNSIEELVDRGFAYLDCEDIVLDIPTIIAETNVLDYVTQTIFKPRQNKKLILNNIQRNKKFLITQDAVFATNIPEKFALDLPKTRRIKPVFNLCFSPQYISEGIATYVVNGRCSITRYIFDGFLIHAALFDRPFCEIVHTYPLVNFDDSEGNIEDLLNTWKNEDIIRYAALQYVNKTQDTTLDFNHFLAGSRLMNKIDNLKRFFLEKHIDYHSSKELCSVVDEHMEVGDIRMALFNFEKLIRQLSRDIDISRNHNKLDQDVVGFGNRFFDLIYSSGIFFVNT